MSQRIFALLVFIAVISAEGQLTLYAYEMFDPSPKNIEKIVDSIFLAEGGSRAKKPFGVISVHCSGYKSCRKVAHTTVRRTIDRYKKVRSNEDFFLFLGKRYAPKAAGNNPTQWAKNVRYLSKSKKLASRVQTERSKLRYVK